tara:strand:- start:2947 stop:3804 length:858 start_codon:yes stop_codon:yes gene_type:complete
MNWRRGVKYKYYFSILSMFRNESWNLKEWIEHYKYHGADHIYLIDDFSDDDYLSIVQPYIDEGYVTLIMNEVSERYTGRQIDITNKYGLPLTKESKWIAHIDLDEYLYSPDYVDLKELLVQYEDYGTILTNWVWFNSSDFIEHPKDGIVKNFTKRAEYNVRVFFTRNDCMNPRGKFEPQWETFNAAKGIANSDFNIKHFNVHDIFTDGPTINLGYKTDEENPKLLLNHYKIQSREYWEKVKMKDIHDANHYYFTGDSHGWHEFYSSDVGDILDERLKEQNMGMES